MLPGVGRRAGAVISDAPRRQPVFTRQRPASALAQHAEANQPLQPTRRRSAGLAYVPGSQPSPRCGLAARSRRLAARTRSWLLRRLGKLLRWSSWPPALQAAVHALYPAIIVYQSAQRLRPTDRLEEARLCG